MLGSLVGSDVEIVRSVRIVVLVAFVLLHLRFNGQHHSNDLNVPSDLVGNFLKGWR